MEKLLTESELAEALRQSVLTVRRNRSTAPHRLPPHVKFGSSVRYRLSTVLEWIALHEVRTDQSDCCAEGTTSKEKRAGPGRPSKAETVRKTKNAGK